MKVAITWTRFQLGMKIRFQKPGQDLKLGQTGCKSAKGPSNRNGILARAQNSPCNHRLSGVFSRRYFHLKGTLKRTKLERTSFVCFQIWTGTSLTRRTPKSVCCFHISIFVVFFVFVFVFARAVLVLLVDRILILFRINVTFDCK